MRCGSETFCQLPPELKKQDGVCAGHVCVWRGKQGTEEWRGSTENWGTACQTVLCELDPGSELGRVVNFNLIPRVEEFSKEFHAGARRAQVCGLGASL